MRTLLWESLKGTFRFSTVYHSMYPVFISTTKTSWFLISTNKIVIVEIEIREVDCRTPLLMLEEYDSIISSWINKLVYLILDFCWHLCCGRFRKMILYLTDNLLNRGFNVWVFLGFQTKSLVDYGGFMKLVKLQSWPKYVQSWNVNNTCFSEMQFLNSDVLKHSTNLSLTSWKMEKKSKTQKAV